MNVRNYRFARWAGDGTLLPSIYRDQTYMLPTGLRCSLTPDGDCVEMTLNARNGPLPGNGPGFGLSNMQAVQLSFAETETPADSDWLPVWYGTLRVGGNPHDYDGEGMTFRGMSRRLEEVTVPAGVYPEADAGAVIRQLAQAVFSSGQLGFITSGPLGTPPGSLLVQYDASLIPDLGFTFKLADHVEQLFGKVLDQIVSDALSKLGVSLVWGVLPDKRFYFKVARTDTLGIAYSSLVTFNLKAPAGETPCTSVLWTVGKDDQGNLIYYRSVDTAPEAAKAGTYVREVVVGSDLNPWASTLDFSLSVNDGSGAVAASAAIITALTDDPDVNQVQFSGSTPTSTVSATMTLNRYVPRLALNLSITHTNIGGGVTVARPGVPVQALVGRPVVTGDFRVLGLTDFTQTVYGLPSGTVITITGVPDPNQTGAYAQTARLNLDQFAPQLPNSTLLDGLAKFYYSLPAVAPADIESGAFVAPADLRGKVTVPLPTGLGDYTENVANYEYRLTDGGLVLGVLAGQPDDPARLAAASLIKALANKAAVTGAQSST